MHDTVACNLAAPPAGIDQQAAAAREILSFRLGREKYGIDILKVQEIRGYQPPTVLIDASPHALQ
jgi:purine-binding chemotaxis protein CheW